MNYSMSGRIENCGEVSAERTQQPFPFLKLPAEIRNMIYRLLLLTQNVTTSKPTTSQIFTTPSKPTTNQICRPFKLPDGVTSVELGQVAAGTVRSKCWRTYKMEYQIAILLTNRHIYHEARGIFQLENFWTIVRVHKAGFAKEMKDRNFPIAIIPTDFPGRHVKFPVLEMEVIFQGGPKDEKQTDVLVVAKAHLKQLMQALWTAKGVAQMCVMASVQEPRIKSSPSEGHLLRPFRKLHGIKRLIIDGVSKHEYVDGLTRAVTTTDGFNQVFKELTMSIKGLQQFIKAKQWEFAIAQEEKHSTLMIDCQIVYGRRSFQGRATREIYIATAICLAEISLHRGDYARTIGFATYSLHLLFHMFRPRNGNPVPSATGIITSANESRHDILVIRARASMGMRQAEHAYNDLGIARQIMPTSAALYSLGNDWHDMFSTSTRCWPRSMLRFDPSQLHFRQSLRWNWDVD